ncbi:MAG: hypothetical protein H6657_10560 [Ardenticatenaceae bacterium]|nr:hypothetical protein [Anaerolineales bacterium]MCB8977854.1 hypothetical protein [Ardenticatenaceae bacterium]
MVFPEKVPGLRLLLGVWLVYTAVWISLEGSLMQVVIMGTATAVLLLGHGWQRWLGGKTVGRGVAVLVTAVSSALLGAGSSLLTFVFMAVKTGLHAHGPEFTQAEIAWVWGVLPLWTAVCLLVGLGLGLIWAGSD